MPSYGQDTYEQHGEAPQRQRDNFLLHAIGLAIAFVLGALFCRVIS